MSYSNRSLGRLAKRRKEKRDCRHASLGLISAGRNEVLSITLLLCKRSRIATPLYSNPRGGSPFNKTLTLEFYG